MDPATLQVLCKIVFTISIENQQECIFDWNYTHFAWNYTHFDRNNTQIIKIRKIKLLKNVKKINQYDEWRSYEERMQELIGMQWDLNVL